MKKLFLFLFALLVFAAPAQADDLDLTYKATGELATFSGSASSGDLNLIWDNSAQEWKTIDASANQSGLVTLSTTATLDDDTHANRTLVMNGAGSARTYTLPAATGTGDIYRFVVGAVNTSKYIISADGSGDLFDGGLFVNTDNASNAVIGFTPGAADDVLTLNGTTTGGAAIGDYVELQDIITGQWALSGMLTASGTEVTPSSSAAQ